MFWFPVSMAHSEKFGVENAWIVRFEGDSDRRLTLLPHPTPISPLCIEEIGTERLSDLLRVTQLVSSRARV